MSYLGSTFFQEAVDIIIISEYGLVSKSSLSFEFSHLPNGDLFDDEIACRIQWRNVPDMLNCEIQYIKAVSKYYPKIYPATSEIHKLPNHQFSPEDRISKTLMALSKFSCTIIHFIDFDLYIAFLDDLIEESIHKLINHSISANRRSSLNNTPSGPLSDVFQSNPYSFMTSSQLPLAEYQLNSQQEQTYQLWTFLKYSEGFLILEKLISRTQYADRRTFFDKWTSAVRETNKGSMNTDRLRWRLHAASNLDKDLQAWYHSVFYMEVYRLKGMFWFRDAVLPVYRQNYDLVDSCLTALEEKALAHVLCSPDTTYGDVAGQMYVIQALLPRDKTDLFQRLTSEGAQLMKHPRAGRPAKKLFRFSYVEGNIYLTWRGKFGNQGVDLGDVNRIVVGIKTEVLKRTGNVSKTDHYLSLISTGRSVDLYFDTPDERNDFRVLLDCLIEKEHGLLKGIDSEQPTHLDASTAEGLYEWLIFYAAFGKRSLPPVVKDKITNKSKELQIF